MKRAIIVDDEQAAINKLEKMLLNTGKIEIGGKFSDPIKALGFLKENSVDIAFLDIEMPKISGIELADQMIDIQSSIDIIFITAYSEYAVEAFRCNALDYLLKPVEKERLEMAVNRIPNLPAVSPQAQHQVKASCFGKLIVTIDGQTLKFRTAKAEELFAYLVDHNGQAVHRNHIMDAFWSDYDGDRALILFNTTLHYLKKAFLQFGVKLNVVHNRGTYTLDMSGIECDAVSFLKKAGHLKSVAKSNVEEYENIAKTYTGNYLEQNDYDWAVQKRISIKELYVRLILGLAGYYLNNGKTQRAFHLIKNGLKYAPVDKELNYMLLKILHMKNDKVSLQRYFELYKNRLDVEFGLEPDRTFNVFFKNA